MKSSRGKSPEYSFVLPSYNKEAYIAEAIESCLEQTVKDWELIIVDDKSTDDSLEIIKHYAEEDDRILWVQNLTNLGIGATRNVGNSFAKGKYVAVADADDVSLPFRLEIHQKYIKKTPVDYFYTALDVATPNLSIYDHWEAKEVTAEKLRDRDQTVLHGTSIYTRKMIQNIRYRDEARINDDWYLVVDCWNSGVIFGFENTSTGVYRVCLEGVSSTNFKKIQKTMKEEKLVIKDRK